MYKIIGKDRFHNEKCYGEFDNLRDCCFHLDLLKRHYGTIIKFKLLGNQA